MHDLYSWRPADSRPPHAILQTRDVFLDPWWRCDIAHDRLICFYEEANRPRRLVAIDLDSGVVETLYDPNPQWRDFDLSSEPRIVPIRLPSGPSGYSYLLLPPDHEPGQRLPLVIVTYDCDGFLRGGTGDEYPMFPFAAQGFAVLCHNIFLRDWEGAARAGGRLLPPEFAPNDGDAFRKRIQDGLDIAVAELDRSGVIDPKRIAITGLSAGAQTVEYALFNMRLTAAIASSTRMVTSIPYEAYPQGRESFRRAGFDSSASARWNTRAISRNADKIRAPLLINSSDAEFESEPYIALENAGRAVEMYIFPGEHHMKFEPAHRLAVYKRNIDWMNFWLRGVESGLTGDPQQYIRWRAMREQQCRLFGPNGTERKSRPRGRENLTDDELVPWYCRPGALKP
jgi:dipeptidyl aminopeptidase/acylaminoacyl peptidase